MIQQKYGEMNKCKICDKDTKNKIYCSVKCQHIGYKEIKIDRIKQSCLYCKNEFETLPNKVEKGKKYCSRLCKDTHQKELYLKDGNPAFGNERSNKWKNWNSDRMKRLWKTEKHKEKVKIGQDKFFNENGFWMGTDDKSYLKRIETNIELYGVCNISKLPQTTIKRDETCLRLYGKTSINLLRSSNKLKGGNTSIEKKIANLLIENGVKFETQYDIFFNSKNFKSYDFYLPDFNLLIEADGDYWHVNPNKYNELSVLTEVQKNNKINDTIKNELAAKNRYNLIRFWETDIKKKNFKYKLFNEIIKYEKN